MPNSCCMSLSREVASWEWRKCQTIFLPIATQSEMLHWLNTPSCTASCRVCAIQPRLLTTHSSIAFCIFRALSRSTTCTLSFLIFHWANMQSNALALVAPVCDPAISCACKTALFSKLWSIHINPAVRLNILIWLAFELHISIVKLMSVTLSNNLWIYVAMTSCIAGRETSEK